MRPQKITFGEMRSAGVEGVLIYCADYKCSHSIEALADRWPDDVRPCRILSRASSARHAASAARTSGRIFLGTRSLSAAWVIDEVPCVRGLRLGLRNPPRPAMERPARALNRGARR